MPEDKNGDWSSVGEYIKLQRRMANLSLRQLADLAEISNPYLSQIERGLHEPSVRVLRSIACALNVSAESLLEQLGLIGDRDQEGSDTAAAIRNDPRLSPAQKEALLSVFRSYISTNRTNEPTDEGESTKAEESE